MIGYNIAISIIAIMFSIGGIILGIGYSINNRKMKEFGLEEIFQSAINGVILGVLFVSFMPNGLVSNSINNIVTSSSASAECQGYMSGNYAICFAYNYLIGTNPVYIGNQTYPSLLTDSEKLLIPISIIYGTVSVISGLSINVIVASINFGNLLAPAITELGFIIRTILTAIMGIYVQASLLSIIASVAIPLILPIGIILRTFYPTRKLGGAIMAISIGLFGIFPLTYLFDARISSYFNSSLSGNNQTSQLNAGVGRLSGAISSISRSNSTTTKSILSTLSSDASSITSAFYSWVNGIIDALSLLIVQVFFLPIFSIILTIISIKELASILGSEVSLGKFDIF
ncbi:MAG: hypothetical protein M1562_02040 [Candidatus Marsarchaeota archaeon]|nr:hypothetical protein [Candidatus Marsarchaeota archaeon]